VEIAVSEKKFCDFNRLKNMELMISDDSGVYRSKSNENSLKAIVAMPMC